MAVDIVPSIFGGCTACRHNIHEPKPGGRLDTIREPPEPFLDFIAAATNVEVAADHRPIAGADGNDHAGRHLRKQLVPHDTACDKGTALGDRDLQRRRKIVRRPVIAIRIL